MERDRENETDGEDGDGEDGDDEEADVVAETGWLAGSPLLPAVPDWTPLEELDGTPEVGEG